MKKYDCLEKTFTAQEMQAQSEAKTNEPENNSTPSASTCTFLATYDNIRELPEFTRQAIKNGASRITVNFSDDWHKSRAFVSLRYAIDLTDLMLKVSEGIARKNPFSCQLSIATRPYR